VAPENESAKGQFRFSPPVLTQDSQGPKRLLLFRSSRPAQLLCIARLTEEVIARHFALHQQIEKVPVSSIAISPANYKFRFAREIKTGGKSAYIYTIAPRKNRLDAITGQVWIESNTGAEVMLTGHVRNLSSIGGRAEVVRDTKVLNGFAYARFTHLIFVIPQLGRCEPTIQEYLLSPENDGR
jgi:hypothetical protein